MNPTSIDAIAQVIQLVVAPVFLLTSIAGFLSVLSHRLGRVVDRTRVIDRYRHSLQSDEHRALLQSEARVLDRRTVVMNWAIRLAVCSALMICIVVVSLFIADVTAINIGDVVAYLFVAAMILLILSLLLLIVEVTIHTRNIRHDLEHLLVPPNIGERP